MITHVIKNDGSKAPFSPTKLNKWAMYAAKVGGNWSEIALDTVKRLPENCKTSDIHQTMIDVCLSKETLEHSRLAARLEYASIRKYLDHQGIRDQGEFRIIFEYMIEQGLWCGETMPTYNPVWEEWYRDLLENRMEYWQVKQWADKYSLQLDDRAIETPQIGILGVALATHGDTDLARRYAKAVVKGKINLATPVINGCRNGDFNTISCCVIKGGDTVNSIGAALHISYEMTAKKAGIGIMMETRSKGDDVKNGRVKHLGKHGIYDTVAAAVKMFTQVGRGGSATMTYACTDPEIESILLWKTQRVDIEERIDKMDYSFAYNDAFLQAVIKNEKWALWSINDAPAYMVHEFHHATADEYNLSLKAAIDGGLKVKWVEARDLLKNFLTCRQETGRIYCINVTTMNRHTPFIDTIYQSNLCQEIALPTKPYVDMFDLYAKPVSEGETAFCSIAAVNVGKVSFEEYEEICDITVRTINVLIDKAPMLTPSMKHDIMRRRSIGVGITGLANYLYALGLDYDGSEEALEAISVLSEQHYYYLLKASQKLSEETGFAVEGIDNNWLPIDTMSSSYVPKLDWEPLRGKGRMNSVLAAHMPTENSANMSDALNGLYPARNNVIYKGSRTGVIQYIAPAGDYMYAWKVDNITLSKYYERVQDFTDQAISADYYVDFNKYPDGKVPLSQLMKEWVAQAKLGNKTMYYTNTNDDTGGSFQDILKKSQTEVELTDDCCTL